MNRRAWARLLAGGALASEFSLAQDALQGLLTADAVRLNANENPLGPCREALDAAAKVCAAGGRYLFGLRDAVAAELARAEGVRPECVRVFAGSIEPLHRFVLACTSKTRPLIYADPTFDAVAAATRFTGAQAIGIPLAASGAHDTKMMLAAGPKAGLFYVCNPNNPTGTVTPKSAIETLVNNKPAGSIVLIDEAYIHYHEMANCLDWVNAGKDVVVLRTFSKIFGLAGLRAGAAIARPELLERLRPYDTIFVPTPGMAAALASLGVKGLVAERRKIMTAIRADLFDWLNQRGFEYTKSVANHLMIDVRRPAGAVVKTLAERRILVGRVWPAWPQHVRVTLGTPEEMTQFKRAFAAVMGVA